MIFRNDNDLLKKWTRSGKIHFGGGSSENYDAEYNARMATIAEAQQGMAEAYFDFWKSDYKPMEEAQIAANIKEIPYQTDLNIATLQAQQELLPGQTALQAAQIETDLEQTALTGEQIAAQQELLPGQTAYTAEQIAAGRELLPGQTALTGEQIAAQRELLPGQTALSELQTSDAMTGIQERAPVRTAFYDETLEGIDSEQWADRAGADVTQSFQTSNEIARRNAARTGINPNSGRFLDSIQSNALDRATSVAGARTQARTLADLESYRRLESAMGGTIYV